MSDKNNKNPIRKAPRQAHDIYFKATFSDLDFSRVVLTHRLPKGLIALAAAFGVRNTAAKPNTIMSCI